MKKVCSVCVMDSSDKTIKFNEEGRCNYCIEAEKVLLDNYHPNEYGNKKLNDMFDKIKDECKNEKYDCLVGVSGGLDSSYVIYLGHRYGLRMLAVHIDDGLDTDLAKRNIKNLCEKTNTKLITIAPELDQYKDLLLSFFKSSVPNLTIPQDNILIKALGDISKQYKFKYFLSGGNFAHESILQGIEDNNVTDTVHIRNIHKRFGTGNLDKIKLLSPWEQFLNSTYFSKVTYVRPLNFIDYNMEKCIKELENFCDYKYYGGKHYESVLTRFLQCWYLPEKYGYDKRKSHLSSLIISGQMDRETALKKLEDEPYTSEELKQSDFEYLSKYFNMSNREFLEMIRLEPKQHSDYRTSKLFKLANVGIAVKKIIKKK